MKERGKEREREDRKENNGHSHVHERTSGNNTTGSVKGAPKFRSYKLLKNSMHLKFRNELNHMNFPRVE